MSLEFFVPSAIFREVFVEPDAAVGRNNQIVVPVIDQQLSSLREEGPVPGWIIWYVRGKSVPRNGVDSMGHVLDARIVDPYPANRTPNQ
jgi:hypothetical protein